ncbi:hypothetical protein BsWGS_21676 [Bradybaena similaris]
MGVLPANLMHHIMVVSQLMHHIMVISQLIHHIKVISQLMHHIMVVSLMAQNNESKCRHATADSNPLSPRTCTNFQPQNRTNAKDSCIRKLIRNYDKYSSIMT